MQDLKDCNLVIEAIFENHKLKQQLFLELAQICSPTTLFATNTSSFRIASLANKKMGNRFFGMHFFYPPTANRLIELIFPKNFNKENAYLIKNLCAATGRVILSSKDECGFVVNRFFVPWLNEAVKLVDDQTASIEIVNALSKIEFSADMGAFEIMNLTGLAPVLHSMETFHQRFGAAYKPAAGLKKQLIKGAWQISNEPPRLNILASGVMSEINQRLRGAVLLPCSQLLKECVCSAEAIEIGARIGLKWNKAPIERFAELSPIELLESSQSILKPARQRSNLARNFKVAPLLKKWRHLQIEQWHGSQIIQLNRPQAMNALSLSLQDQLQSALHAAVKNPKIERIILRGMGKTFAAGGDLSFLRYSLTQSHFSAIETYFEFAQTLLTEIDQCKKPVVALVEGMALGAGVQLALAADLIIATPEASFEFPETGLGLVPGLGGTQRLPERIGRELTKYMVFTGERLNTSTALAVGLVDRICNDLDWYHLALESLEQLPSLEKNRHEKTLPMELAQIVALMNHKNCSRLVHGKSLSNLPKAISSIHSRIKSKSLQALQIANELIDFREESKYTLEAGLKLETESLKKLIRTPETAALLFK
jgi:enoyl-CoA hydratase/3-hydroxyacyl-CoA dehydrogenase